MADYIEYIQLGAGSDPIPVKDPSAHNKIGELTASMEASKSEVEAALATKAPSGYTTVSISPSDETTLESMLSNILDGMEDNTIRFINVQSPGEAFIWGASAAVCRLYRLNSTSATASFSICNNQTPMTLEKAKYVNVWQPISWVNPPMELGVEYRTTKFLGGKSVYVKFVEFGALPNNEEKLVQLLDPNVTIISLSGYAVGPSYVVPLPGYYSIQNMGCTSSTGNVWISTTIDMSSYTGYLTIEYCKS